MLKKFILRNYKNFKDDICMDFEKVAGYQFNLDCISNGIISKAIIYGKNATGKTNFGRALMDIYLILYQLLYSLDGTFLNADSSEDVAVFSYTFQFDSTELLYQYTRLSNRELQKEELWIDGKSIFKCDFINEKYDFKNLKCIGAETANIERYLQSLEEAEEMEGLMRLPFLKWLLGNVVFKGDSILIRLSNYIRKMVMITVGNARFRSKKENDSFYETLENPEKLRDLEDFLNAMGIACGLVLKSLPDGQRELYFSHEKLVPFYENASSGTLALFFFISQIDCRCGRSFVFVSG